MNNILRKSLVLSFFELKIKNQNTYLGFFWYFLQPLFMFAILFYVKTIVFEYHIDNFIPYLFIGVIMVHFFISSTTLMMKSITSNYDLLNAKKIEPEIFVLSKFFMSLWNHVFEAILVVIILCFFGYFHSALYLLVIPIYALFILGVGNILCVLSTKVFDLTYVWNYFCQVLWFILPVYYVVNQSNLLVKYNPISYFMELGRAFAFNLEKTNITLFFICLIICITFYLIGRLIFNSQKDIISERIK